MIYPVRLYGDPVLRKVARPVTEFGDELKELAEAMVETMYEHNGVGLAGPQIGLPERLFVAAETDKAEDEEAEELPPPQTREEKRQRWGVVKEHVMVNPEILRREGNQTGFDGCLSLPGLYVDDMERDFEVSVRYQDVQGEWHELDASGHFAWVIQHEYDHLEGVLFLDRMSEARRRAFMGEHRSELAQMQRDAKAMLKDLKGSPTF